MKFDYRTKSTSFFLIDQREDSIFSAENVLNLCFHSKSFKTKKFYIFRRKYPLLVLKKDKLLSLL